MKKIFVWYDRKIIAVKNSGWPVISCLGCLQPNFCQPQDCFYPNKSWTLSILARKRHVCRWWNLSKTNGSVGVDGRVFGLFAANFCQPQDCFYPNKSWTFSILARNRHVCSWSLSKTNGSVGVDGRVLKNGCVIVLVICRSFTCLGVRIHYFFFLLFYQYQMNISSIFL